MAYYNRCSMQKATQPPYTKTTVKTLSAKVAILLQQKNVKYVKQSVKKMNPQAKRLQFFVTKGGKNVKAETMRQRIQYFKTIGVICLKRKQKLRAEQIANPAKEKNTNDLQKKGITKNYAPNTATSEYLKNFTNYSRYLDDKERILEMTV